MSPHELIFGCPMPQAFNWERRTDLTGLPAKEKISRQEAQLHTETIRGYISAARETARKMQAQTRNQANKHRRDPDFDVGDRVFIVKKV